LFARPIVVTNGQHRFLVAEQLAAIGAEADVLLEPARRDSGPAIAAGAGYALTREDGAVVVALAADHVVTDAGAFAKVCTLARSAAEEDRIVMFGVEPTRPATEYGYIRTGPSIGPGLFAIERFADRYSGRRDNIAGLSWTGLVLLGDNANSFRRAIARAVKAVRLQRPASCKCCEGEFFGALRKLEPSADLFVGESLCNQHHDLSLSAGQGLSELLADRLASGLMLEAASTRVEGNHWRSAATARIHRARSLSAVSLSTIPLAPRAMATRIRLSLALPVRRTVLVARRSAAMLANRSRPFRLGIKISSTGLCPSPHSATTFMSEFERRTSATP
jgi:Nucleotidyl transferase